jgi:hypothetical protein
MTVSFRLSSWISPYRPRPVGIALYAVILPGVEVEVVPWTHNDSLWELLTGSFVQRATTTRNIYAAAEIEAWNARYKPFNATTVPVSTTFL